MNPFNHAGTTQANATAEAFIDRHHRTVTVSVISAKQIGRSFVCKAVRTDQPDLADIGEFTRATSTTSPRTITMTTRPIDNVFDEANASEFSEGDEAREIGIESELELVGRQVVKIATLDTVEAEHALASRAAKRIKSAEKLADETGDAPNGAAVEELTGLNYVTLDALTGFHTPEDVPEAIEKKTNLGLTVLNKANADSFLTLTMGEASCLELTLHNANSWELRAFAKRLRDFRAYDLQAHPEMQFVADSLTSTGRLLDSQGFEAIVWEDIHNSAFIRHCVNVAEAMGYNLYFDKRAQKQCNRLTVKRAPGVSNKVIIAGTLIADQTPEVILEAALRLTGVYAYEAPAAAPSAVKTEVKAVEVTHPAKTAAVKVDQPAATKPAHPAKGKKTKSMKESLGEIKRADSSIQTRGKRVPKQPKPAVTSVPVKPTRPLLSEGQEVLTKVVRFAKFGVIVQDALGNEGFLSFREKGAENKGGVEHDRLVVKIDDKVKVKVVTVADHGFAKVTLLNVVDSINHYLSCLRIGDVQNGLVSRRSEHCFYVRLGGGIVGILAVRDIPNLAEVKDKLRTDTRLNVRITSVNAEKRNFHVVIESFPGSTN